MTTIDTEVHRQLRVWAAGIYTTEAATDLLIRAHGGRFASPGRPWIRSTPDGSWIAFVCIPDHLGALSGGDHRILRIAASLGCRDVFLNLADNITGLDPLTQRLVMGAIAQAGG